MRTKTSKLQQVLAEKGITTSQLATATGLSVRSLHNLGCGNSTSGVARSKVTQFLQVQIWDDVPVFREARFCLTKGDFLVFSNENFAREFTSEFSEFSEHCGRHVRIFQSVQMVFRSPATAPSPSAAKWSRAGDVLEVWKGEAPPDLPERLTSKEGELRNKQEVARSS